MKISFHTLGCKLNFAETSAIGKILIDSGHKRVTSASMADVCVVNTCSVTDVADHKGRQLLHRLHRENPKAKIIVTGCYAQLKPQEIAQIEGVDYVLGNDEKFIIPNLITQLESQAAVEPISTANLQVTPSDIQVAEVQVAPIQVAPIREISTFHPSVSSSDRTRCFLKVQDGCNYFCTYCTIPMARGKSRNADIQSITELARQAIFQGKKEIVLTGVNIGDYGRTTGESFLDLIRSLDSIDAEVRYRISSIEPNLLSDEIIDFVAHSAHFAPHFHIPLQSGTDDMLRLIHRRYDTALFSERISHIKSVMPNAFIGVDVMVGLRGETPEQFSRCAEYINSLDISQLHVFTYSERANTKMLDIDYVVPLQERKRRSECLHRISEQKLKNFYANQQGKEGTVLWESKVVGKEVDATNPMMSGFTENYVRLTAPYDKTLINQFQKVII